MHTHHRRFLAGLCSFYLRQQRYEGALLILEVLHGLEPMSEQWRIPLGFCHMKLKNPQRALNLLRPILPSTQQGPLVARLVSRCLWQAGQHAGARAILAKYGHRPKPNQKSA